MKYYLLTPWSRVLEKLTGSAASQEIPRIFGTRRFITVLTSARHPSLSWANSIQSSQPPPTSWRSILILSSHLRLGLPNGLFPSGFPTRNKILQGQMYFTFRLNLAKFYPHSCLNIVEKSPKFRENGRITTWTLTLLLRLIWILLPYGTWRRVGW